MLPQRVSRLFSSLVQRSSATVPTMTLPETVEAITIQRVRYLTDYSFKLVLKSLMSAFDRPEGLK
jgi:hypothetical protein